LIDWLSTTAAVGDNSRLSRSRIEHQRDVMDARARMEAWLSYCNEVRPHGAIGNKPPISLQISGGATSQPS
jgi:transposase InsO family protein